jgi:dTDP-4-dehydrorhamnose reductase
LSLKSNNLERVHNFRQRGREFGSAQGHHPRGGRPTANDLAQRTARLDAIAPGAITRAAAARGLPLVHISTDYVADQIRGPTCAADTADTCLSAARQLLDDPAKTGTYHLSGGPDVSWVDFAREIFGQAGLNVDVVDIASSDYPTPAARPLNSRLDNSRTQTVFAIARSDWHTGLGDIFADLKQGTPWQDCYAMRVMRVSDWTRTPPISLPQAMR